MMTNVEDEVSFKYDQDLENRILKIVMKIKKNRNRPCYQNIQTMLERGGKIISTEDLITFIDSLIEKKVLENNGTVDKESISLTNLPLENNFDDEQNSFDNIKNNILWDASMDDLDDKFYNTLIKLIKDEVKSVITSEINANASNNILNHIKDASINNTNVFSSNELLNNRNNDDLVDSLKSEITYLRKELASVINLLHKDRNPIINSVDRKSIERNFIASKYDVKDDSSYHNRFDVKDDCHKVNNSYKTDYPRHVNGKDDNSEGFIDVKKKTNKRSITIIGDSIIKEVKPFKMRNLLLKNEKVYVKSFSGATVDCMNYHVKPSLKFNPNLIILNTGTNDLRSNKSSDQIAEEIVELARSIKSDVTEIAVSGIVPRNDELHMKGLDVNEMLKQKLSRCNIPYIDNENIDPKRHLNNSGLHLNYKGTSILANNFINYIKL